jgi:TatD DNase family protein
VTQHGLQRLSFPWTDEHASEVSRFLSLDTKKAIHVFRIPALDHHHSLLLYKNDRLSRAHHTICARHDDYGNDQYPVASILRHWSQVRTVLWKSRLVAVLIQATLSLILFVFLFPHSSCSLLDERFTEGTYRGSRRHEPDLDLVMERAVEQGVTRIILTAGTVTESRDAVAKARDWNAQYAEIRFSCTVGVHPTRCKQVFVDEDADADGLLQELLTIAQDGMTDGTVVAIGEIGLDYDRLQFCPADVQQKFFIRQLEVLSVTDLPLFLHNRSVGNDLYDILKQQEGTWKKGGVVHSFDDTAELATKFTDLSFYIGLNGCSLRTEENLANVARIPLDHILLETDCPYCDVRKTHPGHVHVKTQFDAKAEKKFERGLTVKNRQEPCHVRQIAEIVAGCKGLALQEVADTCYENSRKLFGWDD